jgi:hypothetical protein
LTDFSSRRGSANSQNTTIETMVGVDKIEDLFEEEETDPIENGEELN